MEEFSFPEVTQEKEILYQFHLAPHYASPPLWFLSSNSDHKTSDHNHHGHRQQSRSFSSVEDYIYYYTCDLSAAVFIRYTRNQHAKAPCAPRSLRLLSQLSRAMHYPTHCSALFLQTLMLHKSNLLHTAASPGWLMLCLAHRPLAAMHPTAHPTHCYRQVNMCAV
ncbi:hypothetical protein HPP92_009059 [Vanilla planifolia]|uniref:Uncharacterized protein n=1 Tax=Vanilla planifolia TaxID=51239 RepID=A0A835R9K6_VANPL|nr:hypothetical protein HPP92_009059 [Vanilla planifolia]